MAFFVIAMIRDAVSSSEEIGYRILEADMDENGVLNKSTVHNVHVSSPELMKIAEQGIMNAEMSDRQGYLKGKGCSLKRYASVDRYGSFMYSRMKGSNSGNCPVVLFSVVYKGKNPVRYYLSSYSGVIYDCQPIRLKKIYDNEGIANAVYNKRGIFKRYTKTADVRLKPEQKSVKKKASPNQHNKKALRTLSNIVNNIKRKYYDLNLWSEVKLGISQSLNGKVSEDVFITINEIPYYSSNEYITDSQLVLTASNLRIDGLFIYVSHTEGMVYVFLSEQGNAFDAFGTYCRKLGMDRSRSAKNENGNEYIAYQVKDFLELIKF